MGMNDYDTKFTSLNLMDDDEYVVMPKKKPQTLRLRLYEDTQQILDDLVGSSGLTATQLINKLLLDAHRGKETNNGQEEKNTRYMD